MTTSSHGITVKPGSVLLQSGLIHFIELNFKHV